ncbi:MAG: cytochrome ubiquinol oxidase subunit I, partial [Chloroflexi bacterium]|nr:cytochrome ubiquinol oxidase subunit I [Chloroflexota bacterium]
MGGSSLRRASVVLALTALFFLVGTGTVWAQGPGPAEEYRELPGVGSRLAVWMVAELHLMFAAFVLAVPMFALVIEFMGWRSKEQRLDRLAHEMARLLPPTYSMTAILGAMLVFLLFTLYPRFMGYMADIFGPTMWVYPLFFIAETLSLYFYYYSWDRLQGTRKWAHLLLGLSLNIFGTVVMFIADSWATFMMTPGGVD